MTLICRGQWLIIQKALLSYFLVLFFSRRRRLRVRASSTSDADFLASLTQLMQDRNVMLFSPPPRPRSSSSSLQRSLSSSPSRQELREGGALQGRSRSPSSFSGSPPAQHIHSHDRSAGQGQWGQGSRGRGLIHEGRGFGKVNRWLYLTQVTEPDCVTVTRGYLTSSPWQHV